MIIFSLSTTTWARWYVVVILWAFTFYSLGLASQSTKQIDTLSHSTSNIICLFLLNRSMSGVCVWSESAFAHPPMSGLTDVNLDWSPSWKLTLIDWSIIYHHTQPLHAKMKSPIMLSALFTSQSNVGMGIARSKAALKWRGYKTINRHKTILPSWWFPRYCWYFCWQSQECHESFWLDLCTCFVSRLVTHIGTEEWFSLKVSYLYLI